MTTELSHLGTLGWQRLDDLLDDRSCAELYRVVVRLERSATERVRRTATPGLSQPGGEHVDDDALIVVPEAGAPQMVCRYEYVLGTAPELRHMLLAALTRHITRLCGEPFVPFKDKVNNKYPGGGGYPPHQDIVAYESFGPRYHVTAMLAIDDATTENGCLQIASNFHELVLEHPEYVLKRLDGRPVLHSYRGGMHNGDIRQDIAAELRWVPVPMKARDVVLFDSYVPHFSEPNGSDLARRAMLVTFNAARDGDWYEQYYAEKRKNPLDPKFHVSTPTRFSTML